MQAIQLKPILIDEDPTLALYDNADCQSIFTAYPAYYYQVGYHPPWIGYFVLRDLEVVGVGGFTGEPVNNRVEIAYSTFKQFEGQGIASFTCKMLVDIARMTDSNLVITAKTAPEQNASSRILAKQGFLYSRIVQDHEIGDAWEWVLDSFVKRT